MMKIQIPDFTMLKYIENTNIIKILEQKQRKKVCKKRHFKVQS